MCQSRRCVLSSLDGYALLCFSYIGVIWQYRGEEGTKKPQMVKGSVHLLLFLYLSAISVGIAGRVVPLHEPFDKSTSSRSFSSIFDNSKYGILQLNNGLARTPQMGYGLSYSLMLDFLDSELVCTFSWVSEVGFLSKVKRWNKKKEKRKKKEIKVLFYGFFEILLDKLEMNEKKQVGVWEEGSSGVVERDWPISWRWVFLLVSGVGFSCLFFFFFFFPDLDDGLWVLITFPRCEADVLLTCIRFWV